MVDHLLVAPADPRSSPSVSSSEHPNEIAAPRTLSSSKGATTRQVSKADLDCLAAALTRLLAAHWHRQTSANALADVSPLQRIDAKPTTDALTPYIESRPARVGQTVARRRKEALDGRH